MAYLGTCVRLALLKKRKRKKNLIGNVIGCNRIVDLLNSIGIVSVIGVFQVILDTELEN